jgi:hypothetical protein
MATTERRPTTGNESISFYVIYVIFVVNRLGLTTIYM